MFSRSTTRFRLLNPALVGLIALALGGKLDAQERTWIDHTGKHETVATLVKYDENSVSLVKQNGVEIVVPLDRFSAADIAFVRDLLASKPDITATSTESAAAATMGVKEPPPNDPKSNEIAATTTPTKNTAIVSSAANKSEEKESKNEADSKRTASKRMTRKLDPQEKSGFPRAPVVDYKIIEMSQADQKDWVARGINQPLAGQDFATARATLRELKDRWPRNPAAELLSALRQCAASKEKFLRLTAIELLVNRDGENSFDVVVQAMDDVNFEVRWLAYESLGKSDPEVSLEPLLKRFTGEDSSKIATVLETFGERVEPKLLPILYDPDKGSRLSACSLLGKIGTNESLDDLKKLADSDTELAVRFQAKNAIAQIKTRLTSTPPR